jgi:hypothetical protein
VLANIVLTHFTSVTGVRPTGQREEQSCLVEVQLSVLCSILSHFNGECGSCSFSLKSFQQLLILGRNLTFFLNNAISDVPLSQQPVKWGIACLPMREAALGDLPRVML